MATAVGERGGLPRTARGAALTRWVFVSEMRSRLRLSASGRVLYECAGCHYQSSVTAGTLFHATKLPLTKWFWAIYWSSTDRGSISALRLSKLIGVSCPTAHAILRKLRIAMGNRDRLYRLSEVIELDDALIGGKRPGKRGRTS